MIVKMESATGPTILIESVRQVSMDQGGAKCILTVTSTDGVKTDHLVTGNVYVMNNFGQTVDRFPFKK